MNNFSSISIILLRIIEHIKCKIKYTIKLYLNCNLKVIKCQGMKSIRFLNLLIYEYRAMSLLLEKAHKKRMLRVITLQLDRKNDRSIRLFI